jgi:fumarate reductase iron-sulfur subunit
MKNFTLKIQRYNPETETIYFEEHSIPYANDLTVLDALNLIKEKTGATIAYRWACRMGMCGSCGAIVNGKPVLMCSTFCRNLKQPISLQPLHNFPVIKDLVVDTDNAIDKFREAMPYTEIQKRQISPKDETLQTPRQLKRLKQTSQCIKCMLCYSACPVYGFNKDFIGPAAGALAQRYNSDTRDKIREKRTGNITGKNGVYKCSFIGECSQVCPKSVDPATTLQKLKVAGMFHAAKSLVKKHPKKSS